VCVTGQAGGDTVSLTVPHALLCLLLGAALANQRCWWDASQQCCPEVAVGCARQAVRCRW
jgi:hypothetical protein